MKIDTNMILILGLGAAAVFFFMKSGILNDDDNDLAMQLAAQQQMNAQQQAMLLKAMSDMKASMGASRDDNPWDDPATWNQLMQTVGTIVGSVGSFF